MATVEAPSGAELLKQLGKAGDGKPPLGCMQCGMCAASCPLGYAMEFPPRKLILQAAAGNLDKVLASPSLWMCVACYLCSKRCPRGIELTDALWPALRDAAMQQGLQPPAELQETFQNIFKYGNILGRSPRQRMDWAKDLDVRVLDLSKESRPVEVLWLVGCYPSYYPRNQLVARAFARLLTQLGVTWGVLGMQETSDWGVRPHVRRGRAVRDPRRGQPQVAGQAGLPQARGVGPARLPRLAEVLSAFRGLVPRAALHHVSRGPVGTTQASDREAGGGGGNLPRQLLPGPEVRVLRSAAVAAGAGAGREAGGDVPQPRQRPLLRRRRGRHVAGRAISWRRAASGSRTSAWPRPPRPGPRSSPSPALTSWRASRTPPRLRAWRAD